MRLITRDYGTTTLHSFLIIQVLCGKICKVGLYTELFYAIILA